MYLFKKIVLGAALSSLLVMSFGAARAEVLVHAASDEGVIDAILAGLPIAPSLLFFAAGIVGLAVLSRRRGRKTPSLY